MPRWHVDIIRGRLVGTVTAKTEAEAIEAAVKLFQIEPARRKHLTVTKVSDRDDDAG